MDNSVNGKPLNVEQAVRRRYSAAARAAEPALCCHVPYDDKYLAVLPTEIIERDYGCGDPSRHVAQGETVLDLGCGGGKICYITAQIVGPTGRAIGVDRNDDMLALARRHQRAIGDGLGYHNTQFLKGNIQDLALDLDLFEAHLRTRPPASVAEWQQAEAYAEVLRRERPMIETASIDVIVSNCVLNLTPEQDRRELFAELHRVLRCGGRAVISDITCDKPPPERLKNDPQLWSGCVSGAFVEHELLTALEAAGFYGVEILSRQDAPWTVVEGIEFRSLTVRAFKSLAAPQVDRGHAVVHKGPWRTVTDDDGNTLRRGHGAAVGERTYGVLTSSPYVDQVIPIPPNGLGSAGHAPSLEDRASGNPRQAHDRTDRQSDKNAAKRPTQSRSYEVVAARDNRGDD